MEAVLIYLTVVILVLVALMAVITIAFLSFKIISILKLRKEFKTLVKNMFQSGTISSFENNNGVTLRCYSNNYYFWGWDSQSKSLIYSDDNIPKGSFMEYKEFCDKCYQAQLESFGEFIYFIKEFMKNFNK